MLTIVIKLSYSASVSFRRMRGELTAEEEGSEAQFVKAQLARIGAPHWQQFLAAWH